jgi:nicotinamide mononucleotide transporter
MTRLLCNIPTMESWSPLEMTAVVFGLLSVIYTIRQSMWCWPTGLINVILYVLIFFRAALYSDVVLQVIYVPLQLYGWYHWLRGNPNGPDLPITRLTSFAVCIWTAVAVNLIVLDGYIMQRYFNAALPYWDAAIAVLSLIAQYLLARKVLENWLIWIAVDILALGVYTAKGLYLTTGLYGVYLILATIGLIAWLKSFQTQKNSARGFEVVTA